MFWFNSLNLFKNTVITELISLAIGFTILIIPLVIMTVQKNQRKSKNVGGAGDSQMADLLKDVGGFLALSWINSKGTTSTTIVSIIQSTIDENVFYVVSDKATEKVKDLSGKITKVSYTSWFNGEASGARISSNNAELEVITGSEAKKLIADQPQILNLNPGAANMAILKITNDSVLYEDFKGQRNSIDFK